MPRVYLSPSLENYNHFIDGGTEQEYVNLIADAMEPTLLSSAIEFSRNEASMTLSQVISYVNGGDYDVYVSIHTTTAPPTFSGSMRGINVFYFIGNPYSEELADCVIKNLKNIYDIKSTMKKIPTMTIKELTCTKIPAVLIELGYNDNEEDARWIKDNINTIGEALSFSLAEYFSTSLFRPEKNWNLGVTQYMLELGKGIY
ncbi:MAG: N-acetylmuramoyl-L-alanine amidase [Anaerotignum sp.]